MANNYHFPAPYTGLYGVGGATTVLSKEQLREIRLPRTVEELKRDSGVYLYNAYTASLAYYEALRRGEMTRLFEIKATEANGLDIIADIHDYIGVNLFRTLTRFTTNALFAQYPDSYDSMFWKQFERSAGFNSSAKEWGLSLRNLASSWRLSHSTIGGCGRASDIAAAIY